ncbi:perilipin-3-like isoform X2 [Rhincodon typus]|uniref:perilipin-3-like isoform X2 n=1 Tax=Rhincodon typus TaxID=259920 RepID=UPI0009A3DCA4|nr:perilipin-3-like isoform X2 [Rhincodon typus]XP_048448845.1 perilipin-3-like isoform X2 [Rhincodon typus]XP_048448846.1 perilipin-3-like isoform X2 [Rhincodon typus]
MASEVTEDVKVSDLAEHQENGEQQNVVDRVANLPLVSSAYEMVSAAYNSTKENHPYVKTICDVAEQGVKTITAMAASGTKPIIDKLEPQIAVANEYACKSLDKLEEKLPILQQSTPQVVADTKELVSSTITGAKDAVSNTVTGAKNTVTGVVDMAKGAVHGSIEKTKSVMADGVDAAMASKVGQMVVTGVDSALNKSEEIVDYYLPMTEEELAKLATSVEGFEVAPAQKRSYVRLESLSSKIRHRAYQHSVAKLQKARQTSQDIMAQLHNTMDLIELGRKGADSANQKLHDIQKKLHQTWVDWQKKQAKQVEEEGAQKPEQLESQTLTMARGLTQQLQTTCLTLVSNVHGLPQHIQDKVQQIRKTAETIHTSFSSANSFSDLSGQLLAQSREQMLKIRESMDGVMDYVLHNTPLNWLVGPFAPQLTERPESEEIVEMDKDQN